MLSRLRRLPGHIAAASLAVVFALFVFGVGMRHLADRPVSWVDETVTVLSVWSTFWTAAFVLRWPEFISFDVVHTSVPPQIKRWSLAAGMIGFCALMTYCMPGMIDYLLFLWRETTDVLRLRLDVVYAIFPIFLVAMIARLVFSTLRLFGGGWREELGRWSGEEQP